jgi:hypothetical protein
MKNVMGLEKLVSYADTATEDENHEQRKQTQRYRTIGRY